MGDVTRSLELRFWRKVLIGDGCWLWSGCQNRGYGVIENEGKKLKAHRVSWELANGPIPDGFEIDHICHKHGCVHPDHLRLVTHKQNMEHRSGANRNSRSGIRGVSRRNGKWQVCVGHHGKRYWLGTFPTAEEAGVAAQEFRNQLYTHNDMDRVVK